MDPDQARRFVGPDLGPDCLQMLSADDGSVNVVRFSIRIVLFDCVNSENSYNSNRQKYFNIYHRRNFEVLLYQRIQNFLEVFFMLFQYKLRYLAVSKK